MFQQEGTSRPLPQMRHDVLRQVLYLGVVDVAVVHSVLHTARAEGDVVVHHPRGAVRLW